MHYDLYGKSKAFNYSGYNHRPGEGGLSKGPCVKRLWEQINPGRLQSGHKRVLPQLLMFAV